MQPERHTTDFFNDPAGALEQLESARQLQLPVVDAGRIVGYVSRMRIMNVLASERVAT